MILRLLAFFFFLYISIPSTFGYSFISKNIDGHRIRVFDIPANDEYRVTVSATNTATSLASLIKQRNAFWGINGAYFSPKDYTWLPDVTQTIRIMDGDWFSYSRYFPDTGINGIFWFLSNGTPLLVQKNIYSYSLLRDNQNAEMMLEIKNGIANFPILMTNGINFLPRYSSLGLITEKMKRKDMKSFICRTSNDGVKMWTIDQISLLDVPKFISKFGCIDAINLDNGWSTAIYHHGKYILWPGRNIMDAFVIVKK